MKRDSDRSFTRDAALEILEQLQTQLQSGPDGGWTNSTLESYLEALFAWITDCPGYYRNNFDLDVPTNGWEVICDALMAARDYE
jgi:hypothetical protein